MNNITQLVSSFMNVHVYGHFVTVPKWTAWVSRTQTDSSGFCSIIAWGTEPTWDADISEYSFKGCDKLVVATCKAQEWSSKGSLIKVG